MNADYLLACGIVWQKTADPEAGWELVDALESNDFRIRALAQTLLVDRGEDSMPLLESALATGAVGPEAAASCMAEILRIHRTASAGRCRGRQPLWDVSLS
jgi:hypothetical protein